MAETDILNPTAAWRKDIDDSIGPNYGWEMLRESQLAVAKPAFGAPVYRTIGNAGHTGTFSWVNRSRKCIDKLKQWAEQFEDGYFTLIDHDGGGRHYVGNFVGDMPRSQGGNDKYTVQGWRFVETPGAPMLVYPSDWDSWAVQLSPFKDNGTLACAVVGNWVRPAAAQQDDGSMVQARTLVNAAPAVGDAVTFEYRGYGVRIWAAQGPSYAPAKIAIDGVDMGQMNIGAQYESGVQVVYVNAEIPLDIHRLTITITGLGSAGFTLSSFEVMR